jgi:hypothetical protein
MIEFILLIVGAWLALLAGAVVIWLIQTVLE